MSSASLEMGTATSVDQTSVPSGRTASDAQRACFLADHRDCIDASSVADSNEWQSVRLVISFAAEMLSPIVRSDPENLWRPVLLSWAGRCLPLPLTTVVRHLLQKQGSCLFPLPTAGTTAHVDDLHLYIIHKLYRGEVDTLTDHS